MSLESKVKILQEVKSIFENLKADEKSALFSEEKSNLKLLKKLQKIVVFIWQKTVKTDKHCREGSIEEFNKADDEIPIRFDYVEGRETDRSTLYSFNGPFSWYMLTLQI